MRWRTRFFYKFLIIFSTFIILLLLICANNYFKLSTKRDYIAKLTYINEDLITQPANVFANLSSIRLLNLSDFQYLLEPNICAKPLTGLLAILLVTSYAGHDELRSAHRQALNATQLKQLGLQRIFLLAAIPPREHFITQSQLINEHARFGDLLQGNFMEAYRNLSYKHVMGLKWASMNKCLKSKYIIKIDDDIVFDVFHIKRYLESMEILNKDVSKSSEFLGGYVLRKEPTIRNQANKWYVSPEEYQKDFYPDFLSGWMYLTNPPTALKIVQHAKQKPIFWIDDLWLTGIVREEMNIPLISLNNWFSANSQYLECCVRDLKLENLECEYYVGPNGGDNKLLMEFLHNVEKCYYGECLRRTKQQHLKNTCITTYHKRLPEHGISIVKKLKLRK